MSERATASQIDSILQPLLCAGPAKESEERIADIISSHASPIARKVIRHKLHAYHAGAAGTPEDHEAEDIHSEVIVRLLTRLREFRSSPDQNAIRDFRSYVAVTTYHACYEFLRRKYPQRWQLKNRLRYLLSHHPGLAIWTDAEQWICGFEAWRGRPAPPSRSQELQRLRDNPELLKDKGLHIDTTSAPAASMITAIFNFTGEPLELDDLVSLAGRICGIKDVPAGDMPQEPVAQAPAETGDHRFHLERVWAEIIQLPLRQRIALLLNLRDPGGGGVIECLPVAGVASLRQIAEVLGMAAEELARIWNNLPLDDERIAQYIGATRQQVINLRKCARERLSRRMKVLQQGRRVAGQ